MMYTAVLHNLENSYFYGKKKTLTCLYVTKHPVVVDILFNEALRYKAATISRIIELEMYTLN